MKPKTENFSRCCQALLVAALAGLGSGCETLKDYTLMGKLWENDQRSYCEPLPDPELALFDATTAGDVLVQYNASSDRYDGVLRLSYFLEANRARVPAGEPPHFYHGKPRDDWKAIPVNGQTPSSTRSVSTNTYATAKGIYFTLHRQGRPPETCQLPDYRDDHNVLKRSLLTPLALTGDIAIFGTVIGFIAGYEYLQGGGPDR